MMRLAAALCLTCAAWGSDVVPQPKCTSKVNGKFWPDDANSDRLAFADSMRSGKLEICAGGPWRYRWQHLTIDASVASELSETSDRAEADRAAKPPAIRTNK